MILIYESTATTFTDNGLGSVWPTECLVTEEINGQFELEMEHPIDANAKWEKLTKWRILKAPTHRGDQLFRIYDVRTDVVEKTVKVKARHIFYDLLRNIIESANPAAVNGDAAGDAILAACQYTSGFTFSSDITALSTGYYLRVNPVQALIGDIDQSFVNRWGGEIARDNHTIAINTRLGADNGVRIAYRKNLTGLTVKESTDATYTRIMPMAVDSDNAVLLLTAKYVDSSLIASYPFPLITTVKMDDIKVGSTDYPTATDARAEMTTRVNAMYTAGVDLPKITLDVEFVSLTDTEEYQSYACLTAVAIGDDVTVDYEPLNVDVKLRVVEVKYDSLRERYESLRIGDKIASLGTHMTGVDIDIKNLGSDMDNKVGVGVKYNEVWIDNTDGFTSTATISGIELKIRANGTDGFELLSDNVVVGGFKVVNGKARLITDTFAEMSNMDKVYVSMEPDPDSLADGVMSFWKYDTSAAAWYEFARFFTYQNTFYINAYPDSVSTAAGMRLYAKGDGAGYSMARLFGGTSGTAPYAYLYTQRGTNNTEIRLTDTAITMSKNGSVVATW